MSIDYIAKMLFAMIVCGGGIIATVLLTNFIEKHVIYRCKNIRRNTEHRDRLTRPDHWAKIDEQRSHEHNALRRMNIAHMQSEIDAMSTAIAHKQAQIDALNNTPATETITQAKQRLRAVQARYANAHLQQGDEKHYIIDAPNIFDVTVPETAAYLEAVAHAEQLLDGSTNDAATTDAAMTEAVTAVENAWNTMVSAALQAEQPWPVVIEKTPLEDTDVIRAMQQQRHQQHTEVDTALTRADDAAQQMQQAVTQTPADTDQQRQTPPQQ